MAVEVGTDSVEDFTAELVLLPLGTGVRRGLGEDRGGQARVRRRERLERSVEDLVCVESQQRLVHQVHPVVQEAHLPGQVRGGEDR